MGRPKYRTRKDQTSHSFVRMWLKTYNCHAQNEGGSVFIYWGGYFRGFPLYAVDISSIGGWVDWLVWIGYPGRNACIALECKEPGKEDDLTGGENRWKNEGPTLFAIVTDFDSCEKAVSEALDQMQQR